MCIALLKTPTGVLTKEELQNCFKRNPDMCGFTFVNTTSDGMKYVDIWKGYTKFDDFWEDYEPIASLNDRNILVHFRIATSGGVNAHNCHPFRINPSLSLIHNGVLGCVKVPKGSKDNDTRIFIDEYLKGLPNNIYKNKMFRKILGDMIGHNKFVLLDVEDNYYIINEDLGHWLNGCWRSNYTYEAPKVTTTTTKKTDDIYKEYEDYYDYYYYQGKFNNDNSNGNVIVLDKETTGLDVESERYCPCCGVELLEDEGFFCQECADAYKEMCDNNKESIKEHSWCDCCGIAVKPVSTSGVDECPYCGNVDLTPLEPYFTED